MRQRINSDTIVYIDPIHGWHYHMGGCFMAGSMAIEFGKAIITDGALGVPYIFCENCVIPYLDGKPPTKSSILDKHKRNSR